MNVLQVKGRWNIVKGKLKQKLAHLAEDELEFMEGKRDELLGRIQKRKADEVLCHATAFESCPVCRHQAK